MAGTEGTGEYVVIAVTGKGRVGYRVLEGAVRVRVEPKNQKWAVQMAPLFGYDWKVPDGQFRFSTVVSDPAPAIRLGLEAIGAIVKPTVQVNATAPDWAKALLASAEVVNQVKA